MDKPSHISRIIASVSKDWQSETWAVHARVERYEVKGNHPASHTLLKIAEDEMDTRVRRRIQSNELMKVERMRWNAGESIHLAIWFPAEREAEAKQLLRAAFDEDSAKLLASATAIHATWQAHKTDNKPQIHARSRSRTHN